MLMQRYFYFIKFQKKSYILFFVTAPHNRFLIIVIFKMHKCNLICTGYHANN